MNTSDKQRILEIAAVIITGLGKFILMDLLNLRLLYISAAILFWTGYVYYRFRQNSNVLDHWGLNTKHFKQTFRELLPIALILIVAFYLIGNYLGTNVLSWHILPILLVYPIWGIIQQFLIVGLIAGNLRDLNQVKTSIPLIIFFTAIVFAVVHFPFLFLVIATFFMALVYSYLYLHGRNLLVLGMYHGWLGAVFFYTVMGRDALAEVIPHLVS
ncbi:MAG: CPBP family glutamic-type intramembrane protease [Saprospiraceae bacterium]